MRKLIHPLAILLLFVLLLSACKRKWTEDDKAQFMGGCLKGALPDMGDDKAKAFCGCMLQKMMNRYPDASDAHYASKDTGVARLALDCLKHP